MERFEGRVAIVTGGAQGIGRAVIERLVAQGAGVVLADIDGDLGAATARAIDPSGRTVRALTVDVSSRADVHNAVRTTLDAFGRLDVMISHAGIAEVKPFLDQGDASWNKMLAVNMTGAFLCIQESALIMKDLDGGSIVVTASTNAFWMESNAAAYNASKGGVRALVRSTAIDLAPFGIRVNSVAPGLIRTRLTRYLTDIPEHAADYLRNIPLRRFGEPEDVADAILFLASDESRWITGHDLVVDGGQTIGIPLNDDAVPPGRV